ncbi:MAG TPA: NAD-dependent epimerase/dehydratase family protein, partial [Longimicrobiales bacterium]|nr:NAD-dependent epimerase/dehydratase family protein [Longimicrobiales bacterium]
MNRRTVYLTGATGFIGNRLARLLAARGDRLRCLVRASSQTDRLGRVGAELVVADITDAAAQEEGMRGCDVAYHLAAVYDLGVVDHSALERANVEGTRAFLQALERSAVGRAVYVSTTAALGPAVNGMGDRLTEYGGPYPSVYHRTKAAAHGLARAAQTRGARLIIACPAFA